jgi:hypothetical protein
MPTPYQLWLADKKKREQEAAQNAISGKVNFKEASTASRPQYTLPNYQGKSESKNYEWESNILSGIKAKGAKNNNDRFDYVTKQLGMDSNEAKDFRNFLDFQNDSQQTIRTNKDGSVSKNQNVRLGQGIRLQQDAQKEIFSNLFNRMGKEIQNKQKTEVKKAQQQQQLANNASKERTGFLGFLDKTLGRVGNAAHSLFGEEFVKAENQNYADTAVQALKKNPKDKAAMANLQMLNTVNRAPKDNIEKASDLIGRGAAEAAPYMIPLGKAGTAVTMAEGIANKLGVQGIKSLVAKDLIKGGTAGLIAGTEKAGLRHVASGETLSPEEYAKQIGFEAGLAGGGDAVLGTLLRNLNLKGQLSRALEGSKTQKFDAESFQKALQDAYGPKGNVSNVLADAQKSIPKPFKQMYKGVKVTPKTMDSFIPKEIPKVDVPPAADDWFTFAESGQGSKARGAQQASVGRYTKEMINKQADTILNQSNALKNAPEGGYNNRLLDIQNEMKSIIDGAGKQEITKVPGKSTVVNQFGVEVPYDKVVHEPSSYWQKRYEQFVNHVNKSYNGSNLNKETLDDLWTQFAKNDEPVTLEQVVDLAYPKAQKTPSIKESDINMYYDMVKKPGDPNSLDELVKLAELEHNAASAPVDLKRLLRSDPKIADAIKKLNALGGLPKKSIVPEPKPPSVGNMDDLFNLLNPNFKPKTGTVTPNGMKLNIPVVKPNESPLERLQNFLNGGNPKPTQTTTSVKKGLPSLQEMMSNLSPKTEQAKAASTVTNSAPKTTGITSEIPKTNKISPLKSIKTDKDINGMTTDELQNVYRNLADKQKTVSQSGDKVRLQEIQEDMQKVSGLLKMNLQFFGERAHPLFEDLPDTLSHIGSKTDKKAIQVKPLVDKAYTKTVDNLHRLSQFDKQVESVLGRDLKPSESTHLLGLNSRGSDMISKQILTENMVDKSGNVVGSSLKDITMKIPKGQYKEFEDYLVNRHAITRMERGEKVFPDEMQMTPDKSRAIVSKYEEANPEFKDLAQEYYRYNRQLGEKWLVDGGILSKEEWKAYLRENPNYVPNNRIFSDIERPLFYGTKKGFSNQSNPIKKAVGSQRKIVSPIESTIEHTAQYVKTAKRNEVMQTLINNIKEDPEAFKGWAEIMPTEKGAGTYLDSIANKLKDEGIEGVLDEFNKAFEQKPDLTKGNIVRGLIDGKPVHVRVHDPELLDALTNLQPKAQNFVVHSLGQLTRMMKTVTTGVNPVFSLTRNIFRDIPTAYTFSKTTNNPFVFSKDLVESVVSVVKNDELYRSFKAVGGGHSSPLSSDVNLLAQSKRSILPVEPGVWNKTKSIGGKVLGGLENLNNAVEAAPRLAEFKRIAQKGDYDSMMKGLYEANDVTVNFNKYGNVTKEFDALIPYLNAAVQGMDKTGQMFLNAKTAPRAVAKAFAAITIPSIIDFSMNHNNPDYQKLSNFVKDNNIVISKGDGTFYKIPVPRELGVVFHSGVTRVLRAWVDQDPKAFDGFAKNVLTNFALPTRTILAPFNDLRSNKNYMDAPIVPGDLQGLSPQYQYDSKTSQISKKLGSILGVSPIQADYIIKSYGGVLGELGIPLNNKNGSVLDTLKQKVTADPVFSNDMQSNFYNEKTKLDQAHNDLAKQGVKSKNLNEELRKLFNKKSLEMGKIRKQMKEVQNDSSLSKNERLQQLRILQEKINQIAESANQQVR